MAGMAQQPRLLRRGCGYECTTGRLAGCGKLATTVPPLPNAKEGKQDGRCNDPASYPQRSTQPRVGTGCSEVAGKTPETPAGPKVLLPIRRAFNTTTAQAGDGVYLQSSFPVIANGRAVLIPAGVYVQGVVDSVERHIRIKGPAKLTMHFTSIIFPMGRWLRFRAR